jgi:hypothetical protein
MTNASGPNSVAADGARRLPWRPPAWPPRPGRPSRRVGPAHPRPEQATPGTAAYLALAITAIITTITALLTPSPWSSPTPGVQAVQSGSQRWQLARPAPPNQEADRES